MFPCDIAADPRLQGVHFRIYVFLAAGVYEGNVSRIGLRLIGKLIGKSAHTVARRISDLEAWGYVVIGKTANGERAWYELPHHVHGAKQGKEQVVRVTPRSKRIVSLGA